jgi:hypothetical protein
MVYEGGSDSTASVPRGRAHAIKRFHADRQTIFKKDIFLKKDFDFKKRFLPCYGIFPAKEDSPTMVA